MTSCLSRPLVQIEAVSKTFGHGMFTGHSKVRAVDNISFSINERETVGLVGESGSGKSTLGRIVMGLDRASSGRVVMDGEVLEKLSRRSMHRVWRNCQMVFQDPYSSLNPRMTVRDALIEPLRNFGLAKDSDAERLVREALDACGLPLSALDRYPREFSGGQRQRIGLARSLVIRPKFIVADEPVSALDVSIQAQIINLMQDLKREFGLTYLFIAHDLAVVRHVADWLAVMFRGRLVEFGRAKDIYAKPTHPYTQLLLRSVPIPNPQLEAERRRSKVASHTLRPTSSAGCAFYDRCPLAEYRCSHEPPALLARSGGGQVACHAANSTT